MSTAPTSQILTLTEMVNYQDAAVVSRQVTKAEAGNVTLFAFDQDQGLSEHTAPFDALVQILDGQAEISIASVSYTLKTGQSIILPANQTHALRADQPAGAARERRRHRPAARAGRADVA